MANAKMGQPQQISLSSGTYDGFYLSAVMFAAASNVPFVGSDLVPANIQIKVLFKMKKNTFTIMQNNLLVLGLYWTLDKGFQQFLNGTDILLGSSGVYANKLRHLFIPFGGDIRVDGGELIIEITPSNGCFSSNCNPSTSYVEFFERPSIGYMHGIPLTDATVINPNVTSQSYDAGNNVTRLAILNFDQDTLVNEVVTNLSLASDKLSWTGTFNYLQYLSAVSYGRIKRLRFGSSLPVLVSNFYPEGLDFYPQSYLIFNGSFDKYLMSCKLNAAFNSANVSSSNNYFVCTKFSTDNQIVSAARGRMIKHKNENIKQIVSSTSLSSN